MKKESKPPFSYSKQNKIIEWINTLPSVDTKPNNNFSLNGVLVHYDTDHIRIILNDLTLSIITEDVIDIKEVFTAETDVNYGIPVVITIKVNCRLRGIGPSSIYKDAILQRKKPFALSCRPQFQFIQQSVRYQKLQKEFLERNHVEVPSYDSYYI